MSVTTASKSVVSSKQVPTNKNNWVRPSDWVDIGTYDIDSNIFAGVYPVYNINYNFCALRAQVSSGTYTVDWGDGVVETFTSTTNANHSYTYSSITNTVTTRNYKTVLVKVYPTTPGSTLDVMDLSVIPSTRPSTPACIPWLDIFATNSRSTIGGFHATTFLSSYLGLLERCIVNNFGIQSYLFTRAYNIQVLSPLDFGGANTLQYAFNGCQYLESLPPIYNVNLQLGGYNNTFSGCTSLREVHLPATSDAVPFSNAFQDCKNLTKVTGSINATTLSSAFLGCGSLKQIDATFDVSKCTTIAGAFSACSNLIILPDMSTSTSLLTNANSACSNCTAITKPLLLGVTTGITTYASMYSNCVSLFVFDTQYSVSSCTTITSMFVSCASLTEIVNPFAGTFPVNFSATGFNQTFYEGSATPNILSKISFTQTMPTTPTSYSLPFPRGCNLSELSITGLAQTFSIVNNIFSANALNALYTSLATVTGKTITVTGNPGTASDTPSIATAKGWSVVG